MEDFAKVPKAIKYCFAISVLSAAYGGYYMYRQVYPPFDLGYIDRYQNAAERLAAKLAQSHFVYSLISQRAKWCGGYVYDSYSNRAIADFMAMKVTNKYMQKQIDFQDLFIKVFPARSIYGSDKFIKISVRVRIFNGKNHLFVEAEKNGRMYKPININCKDKNKDIKTAPPYFYLNPKRKKAPVPLMPPQMFYKDI